MSKVPFTTKEKLEETTETTETSEEPQPDEKDLKYWHAGVYNVMGNLTKAIGPLNFLFSTGD